MRERKFQRGFGFVQLVLVALVILVMTAIALKMFQRTPLPPVGAGTGHPARQVLDKVTLRIEGMAEEMDALQVQEVLRRVNGVAGVRVDFRSGKADLTFDPRRTNVDALIAAVDRAGYRARR